ncbi:MAG: flagellar hook-length control protein FliK [Paraglaciecola sp.]|uniref:flagellar hook-length control protein FliK n=1 Tax=Paraglaciecola sp. TaxID=1920173 RepID=UPI00329843BF
MMQQVATAKSELAAFAISAETSGQQKSAMKEQFGLLLKDQQNSLNKHEKAVSSVKDTTTKGSTSGTEKSTDISMSKHNEEKSSRDTQVKDAAVSLAKDKYDKDKVALDDKSSKSQPKIEGHDDVKVKSSEKGEHDVIPRDAHIDASKSTSTSDIILESDLDIELENIDLQQWVNLVDNLQGMNNGKADTKELTTKLSGEELVLSDLLMNKPANGSDISFDEVENSLETLNLSNVESNDTSQVQVSQLLAETIMGQLDKAPNKDEFSKIVSGILDSLSDEELTDVTADNLKASLDILTVSNPDALAELDLPDLIKDVNKSLLLELLQDSGEPNLDEPSIMAEVDNAELLVSASEQAIASDLTGNIIADEEVESSEIGQIVTATGLDNELAEEVSDAAPEVVSIVNSIISPNENKHSEVKALLDLPDTKLNKVLENISSRVIEPEKVSDATLSEQNQLAAQRSVTTLIGDLGPASELASKEFVAALKIGLQEFKSQLAQGREPGIDLKALIAEAATKVSDQSVVNKTALSSDMTVNSVSQVIDFASTLSQALEHNQNQSYNNHARDVAQIQGEQSKQVQLNQLETKYDKAINITKPEGHQQLAEKVRWMVNTKNLVADIRLDPAELGSVHVKVAVSGDSATVNFVVQSHHARDAMDSATPRLREMLADKGIELGQSSVRQENNGQQQEQGEFAGNGGGSEQGIEELEVPETMLSQQNVVNGALGGIDYFV